MNFIKQNKFRKGVQRGFTLVELLTATAVLSLMMVGALTLVAQNHDAYRRGMTIAALVLTGIIPVFTCIGLAIGL